MTPQHGAALPPLARMALFLDLDGTLLDIAATPESVVVPPGLPETLRRLRHHLGDALAIVTGRPVAQVEALLPGIPFAIAGEHGGAIRPAPTAPLERVDLPAAPEAWLTAADRLASAAPGVRVERKARGFVLHYRAAPDEGPRLLHALTALVDTDPRFRLLPALMAWEIKPRGADKGSAVAALMRRPPFAGRLPLFVGDDLTDEDGMREAARQGGAGLRVPEAFGSAAATRAWLATLPPPL